LGAVRGFIALISFLTIYPTPARYRSIYEAASAFPLAPIVGLLRGAPIFATSYILSHGFPQPFLVGVSIVLHMAIQGFLHIDGLIDFGEALLAHRFGRSAAEVMKDRYRGSYGIAVATAYLALLYSSISSIDPGRLPVILLLGEVIHGASMVAALWAGNIEPYNGLGRLFKERLGLRGGLVSILLASAVYMASLYPLGLWLYVHPLVVSITIAVAISKASNRVLGYVSGDVAGFSGEVCYLAFIASWVFL